MITFFALALGGALFGWRMTRGEDDIALRAIMVALGSLGLPMLGLFLYAFANVFAVFLP